MKHRLVALVALALLLAAVIAGTATAAPPMTPAEAQATGQQAISGQGADTTAGSGQYQPANQAVPTRIGSSGDGGDVTQTNLSAAAATSANENETDQTADQSQAGGAGGSYGQAAGQAAESEQKAESDADSTQVKPSNVNVPIRILSDGDDGDVTQTNASVAAAASANGNKTDQSVDQSQSGGSAAPAPAAPAPSSKDGSCCSDASYAQAAGQESKSEQKAESDADSKQVEPSNINVPIRILSDGDGGDVTQTNASVAAAASANGNKTDQSVDQTQSGGSSGGSKCCSDASYTQAAGQESKSEQKAESDADSTQVKPRNINVPIRILSPGDDGDVTQTNASLAAAASLNANKTDQSVDQTQSGGGSKDGSKCCSDASYAQAAGQESKSEQKAHSDADSTQYGASNINVPIRIGSKGDGGDVTQTNASLAAALSANANKTDQDIDQSQGGSKDVPNGGSKYDSKYDPKCGCSSDALYTQAAGQESKSDQWADSDADSKQVKPSNVNAPVRIGSKGDDGDVTQTNLSAALAASLNANKTDQDIDQTQGGRSGGSGSGGIYNQAAGQEAKSEQGARSDADSTQYGASNVNAPVRIDSKGDGADVTQTNASLAAAISANANKTEQDVDQTQGGSKGVPMNGSSYDPKHDPKCGCSDALYVQAAGQAAHNDQWADSDAESKQIKPSNTNAPVRIDSKGDDGDVTQTNASLAAALSANANKTDQSIDQTQGGGSRDGSKCCSDAIYIQAAGQESKSEQGARSDADSTQYGASNANAPVRIDSKGDGGDVTQTNASLAAAISANANKTEQDVDQTQGGGSKHDPRRDSSCCGSGGLYIQAAGQSAENDQWADSDAESKQIKPSNTNVPVRIDSKGDDGDVTQTNASLAAALSANANKTDQSIDQTQGGGSKYDPKNPKCCGSDAIYIQAAGQESKSEQGARSDADSTQYGASNVNAPVRIDSKGDGGDVTQTNLSAALAASLNANKTEQDVDQTQGGGSKYDPRCGCSDALYVQASGQSAKNDQWADSDAESKQIKPSNTNVPVRIDSKGDDGDVTQTNLSAALAASLNANETDQKLDQTQGGSKHDPKHDSKYDPKCGCSDALYVQAAGQESKNDQWADSNAESKQVGAKNVWDPVRIHSRGTHGDVTQLNASLDAALSANANKSRNHASQSQAGSGSGYQQALGQAAGNRQKAGSGSRSHQGKAKSKGKEKKGDKKGKKGERKAPRHEPAYGRHLAE